MLFFFNVYCIIFIHTITYYIISHTMFCIQIQVQSGKRTEWKFYAEFHWANLLSARTKWWVNQAQAVLQDGTGGWALAPWWPRLPLAMNTRKLLIDWKVEQEQESKEENITVIRQPNHLVFINSLFTMQTFQTWSSWNCLGNMIIHSVNHETFCLGLVCLF